MKNIVKQFEKWNYRLAAAHLVDSHYCSDPFKYISVLLLSLQTMLKLELPHVNVLSKFDLIEQFGELAFGEDFYTEVLDLDYLVDILSEGPFGAKWVGLNKGKSTLLIFKHLTLNDPPFPALCELVTEFDLVNFIPLCIEDKESVFNVIKALDKANGFFYGDYEPKEEYMLPVEQLTDDTYPGLLLLLHSSFSQWLTCCVSFVLLDALEIQERFEELSMEVIADEKNP